VSGTEKHMNAPNNKNSCVERRVYTYADKNEASQLLQKDNFMKTIFNSNNRGKSTLSILLAVAVLSFVVLHLQLWASTSTNST
jgi:hypothetical protein